jgi:ATP-dependent 26S proteasome regulatory subunit
MENEDYQDLVRTWLFRMLKLEFVLTRFVGREKLGDEEVARTLGMHKWIPGESELETFFRNRGDSTLSKLMRQGKNREQPETTEPPKFTYDRPSALSYINQQVHLAAEKRVTLPHQFRQNCERLAALFGLAGCERELVSFHILQCEFSALFVLPNIARPKNRKEYVRLLAIALGHPTPAVEKALDPQSPLFTRGLLKWEKNDSEYQHPPNFFDQNLAQRMVWAHCTKDLLIRDIVTPTPKPSLRYSDYPHLKDTIGHVRAHLRRALREKRPGVNLFIYGDPGTGKSELPRVLARELRAELFEVASEDEKGNSVEATERLEAYTRANGLLRSRRSMLVFEEAEDIFRPPSIFSSGLAAKRKGWINRQLENNPVPVLWISNSTKGLDPAFTRRFDFIFNIKPPPKDHRLKLYRKLTAGLVPRDQLEKLASCESLTPAVVARAASVAKGVKKSCPNESLDRVLVGLIEETLQAQGHVTHQLRAGASKIPSSYALDCLNTDSDLHNLTPALKNNPSCRICLYGPPGTGKTTLGHWLSRQLGRPLHLKRASDLIKPHVGETEEKIAEAFAEAQRDEAMLMIDEVDSFLQERSLAARSWEISQVNEMLTQIENFEGTFIASTNLMDDIDQAALRRFDLKLKFNYLRSDQIKRLLKKYGRALNLGHPPQVAWNLLKDLENCTPGDFANAARQHHFRNFCGVTAYAEAIANECSIKKGGHKKAIGFTP